MASRSASLPLALVAVLACRSGASTPKPAPPDPHTDASQANDPSVPLTSRQPIPPSPPPAPLSDDHTVETATPGTEIGTASVPRPARVGIEIVQVVPPELRALAQRDRPNSGQLLRCVLRHHPERTTISGSLSLTLLVGPMARVARTHVDGCAFAEPEICECMRDEIARKRFASGLENAEIQLLLRAHPPG